MKKEIHRRRRRFRILFRRRLRHCRRLFRQIRRAVKTWFYRRAINLKTLDDYIARFFGKIWRGFKAWFRRRVVAPLRAFDYYGARFFKKIWSALCSFPFLVWVFLLSASIVLGGIFGPGLFCWFKGLWNLETPDGSYYLRPPLITAGAALFAVIFLFWRNLNADKQLETAQLSLQEERYQKGVELLGHKSQVVRIGGLYALHKLAEDLPEKWALPVLELMCIFVRNPPLDEDKPEELPDRDKAEGSGQKRLRRDVKEAVQLLGFRGRDRRDEEERERAKPKKRGKGKSPGGGELDFRGADLAWGRWRGVDLGGADFFDAKLDGANFREAKLDRANFREAKLAGAYFRKATLTGAYFVGAKLPRVGFLGATLTDANFVGAKLTGARFNGATLERAVFSGATLERVRFSGATLTDAGFSYAMFTDADFRGATLPRADFSGATLVRAVFSGAKLPGAVFSKATLPGTYFREATLTGARFCGATLTKAHFEKATLTGVHFEGATLTEAELFGADITKASLTDANLSGVILLTRRNFMEEKPPGPVKGSTRKQWEAAEIDEGRQPVKIEEDIEVKENVPGFTKPRKTMTLTDEDWEEIGLDPPPPTFRVRKPR